MADVLGNIKPRLICRETVEINLYLCTKTNNLSPYLLKIAFGNPGRIEFKMGTMPPGVDIE